MKRLFLASFLSCVLFGTAKSADSQDADFSGFFKKGCAKGALTTTVGTACGVLSAFGFDTLAHGLARAAHVKLIKRGDRLRAVPRFLKNVEHVAVVRLGTCCGMLYNFVVGGKDLIACLDKESHITSAEKAYAAGRIVGSLVTAGLTAAVLAFCPVTYIGR